MTLTSASFVPDGESRLESSAEFATARRTLRDSIAASYAPRLATAGFFRRLYLRWMMRREFARTWRAMSPSDRACWSAVGLKGYDRQD